MITFMNPRTTATFTNWPLGGGKRGQAVFSVETHPTRGQRAARTTTGKPKYTTYANQVIIVDGSNGRTYLLMSSTTYGESITINSSDMQHNASREEIDGNHYITPTDPEYAALRELFAVCEVAQ